MSGDTPNPHHQRINFGKHAGELFTRLPVSYFRWMVRESTKQHDIAQAELDRRGIPLVDDEIEISGHAIDTASLRLWAEYRTDHGENEGLHAWLKRITKEAMQGEIVDGRVTWRGRVTIVVELDPLVVIVKTVMIRHKSK